MAQAGKSFIDPESIKNMRLIMIPELSYSDMAIGKGDQAMMAWWRLINNKLPTDEAEKTKIALLLEYCKLDTLAMVKIFKKLAKMI